MHHLTERKLEVLRLICFEYKNEAIAINLGIAKHTVERHREHLMKIAHAQSVIGLLRWALNHGHVGLVEWCQNEPSPTLSGEQPVKKPTATASSALPIIEGMPRSALNEKSSFGIQPRQLA